MAEEETVWKGPGDRGSIGARVAAYWKSRGTSWQLGLGLTFLFFWLSLAVYHFSAAGASLTPTDLSSPWPTVYNTPIRQADAFLHGRLDVGNALDLAWLDWSIYEGKYYPLEPFMMAVVTLPGVVLYGLALNQTLVSVVVGALSISVLYQLMRGISQKTSVHIWLTLLFAFGTIYWWNAANGGQWYFAHTLAVLFLFLAVYEALVGKRPFTAGLFLGAAYMTRLPTIMALPFFVIMFSDQWLRSVSEFEGPLPLKRVDLRPLRQLGSRVASFLVLSFVYVWKRLDLKPLLQLGAGVGIFFVLGSVFNYLRFDTPLHASYYHWPALQKDAGWLYNQGLFDITYIPRHIAVMFEKLPYMTSEPPYIFPSWGGMAFWASTPAFLYALFAGIRNRLFIAVAVVALIITLAIFTFLPVIGAGPTKASIFAWAHPRLGVSWALTLAPFWILIAYSLFAGIRNRNKLVVACWAAIIPMALVHFTVGVTGWPQFGYRYVLDYSPFLLLLTWQGMGNNIRWHQMALISASILVNLVGVLWIYHFHVDKVGGMDWIAW